MEMNISFRPLVLNDLMQLHTWFQKPIVNKWWAKEKDFSIQDIQSKYQPRIEGQEKVPSFIIIIEHHEVGFIQYYALNDFLPEGVENYSHELFNDYPATEIAGIDLFIGEEGYLNKGYGSKVIERFLKEIVFQKYKAAVIDPDIENKRTFNGIRFK